MKQAVYNLKKEKVKEIDLAKNIFGLEVNHDLLNQVVYVYNSNQRKGTAHTKTKANVRGGGRKPWRQKGTGNARTGSIRNPIFRGGGIIFGPTKEKIYKRKINKKVKLKAFLSVLSSKVKDTQMIIFDDFKFKKPNTKKLVKVLAKFEAKQKSVLLVSAEKNENLKKSLKNIQKVNYRLINNLNSLDLLNHKYLYLDEASVNYLNKKYKDKQ